MTETTGIPDQQNENLRAFLRYLPKRIAAFERRILRYRFDGWDPRGMAVLSGDVRRVADASERYGLTESHQRLLMLAHMVSEHFTTMRSPDPHQVQLMFAQLSAVTRSLPSLPEPGPASASGETATAAEVHREVADAPDADAIPARAIEAVELTEPDAPIETIEPVPPLEQVALPETIEPSTSVEPIEQVDLIELSEPTVQVESIEWVEPVATVASIEPVEQLAAIVPEAMPVAPVELSAAVEPTLSTEPSTSVEAVEPTAPTASFDPMDPDEPEDPDDHDATGEAGLRRIFHLTNGNAFASELGQRLESEGYAIEAVESLDELSEFLMCLMPQLLLVDASHMSELAAVAALRRDAQHRSQPPRHIQMVVMAAKDNLESRRAAHRAGADLLLFPPFDIAQTVERLQALHSSMASEKVRVLIVDDERADALYAQMVLARAGMQAHVEHDPMQVLESLKTLRPDLVLMDLHMPFANGVEVTMLIREHPIFARLPIVFLSGESDPDSRLEAINAGGDDFLFKPIRPRHLIAAVQDRVRRMHPINKQGSVVGASDEATGT
ncbi:MAG TPA: response regulator [Xanthomonadaceae bacterium]|jgi:DNA-binding response OmpR family regulator|nr:response regulator [Xanthomonadaceae bacterium]